MVQEQLAENKKKYRISREEGPKYLLRGLTVCKECGYAFYGSKYVSNRCVRPFFLQESISFSLVGFT